MEVLIFMKKSLLFILLLFVISSIYSLEVETFCNHYFYNEEYDIVKISQENTTVFFAHNKFKNDYITRGIVFFLEDSKIVPILYVDDYLIEDNDFVISNNPMPNNSFYAWKIKIQENKIYFTPYMKKGKSVTDPIILEWNNFEKKYVVWKINSKDL